MSNANAAFRIIEQLNQAGVEYIVVGGMAAVLLGAPLVTADIDIVHRRTPERSMGNPHPRRNPTETKFSRELTGFRQYKNHMYRANLVRLPPTLSLPVHTGLAHSA